MNRKALINATVIGTVLQLAMVLVGHWVPAVANLFAVIGILISLVAGLLYARAAKGSWSDSTLGGVIAGALCALIGIAVSFGLGDVEAIILVIGTLSSAVGGVIGGAVGKVLK
jgi:heme O synthase-like polyprenyltransferase